MALTAALPPPRQLDREHKVLGLLPRLSFTDKSTYIESSTKVYDDVSAGPLPKKNPTPPPQTPWDPP